MPKKCNCGLQKHPLQCENLTACDLQFQLQNYYMSESLHLVHLIHASLNGRLQITFLLIIPQFFGGRSVLNCIFCTKTEQCKFRYVTLKYQPLSGVLEYNFFLQVTAIIILSFAKYNNQCSQISLEASFIIKKPRFPFYFVE